MPVRSLRSSVLKWPDRDLVDRAVREWAARLAQERADVRRVGYFGSYARGNWGVGSDLDLLVIVRDSARPFVERAHQWDVSTLPVPAELLVYTEAEWQSFPTDRRFLQSLQDETVWVLVR